MNVSKRLLILISVILLAACQTTETIQPTQKTYSFQKDGATLQDRNQDNYQCLQEAQQQESYTYIPPPAFKYSAAGSSSGSVTNFQLYEACMAARGWRNCLECIKQ